MFENFQVPNEWRPSDPRFGCGPSLVPTDHLQKLAATGMSLMGTSHRKSTVRNIVKEIQEGLREYFSLPSDYEVVLGNGGATLVWDMMGLGMVEQNSLHFTCGEFSEKCYKAHNLIPWIKSRQEKVEYGKGIDIREDAGFDLICGVLNETSTGVQLPHIPKMKNPQTILAIDATSGAGQMAVDFSAIDMFYFSPQKVFASEGGLYVAVLSPKAIERALKLGADKSRYIPESLKWQHAIENSRQNQTYNTPAIATLFLLNEQIKHLNHLGLKTVLEETKRKGNLMHSWADAKPYLSSYVKEAKYRSPTVATIDIDGKFPCDDLTKMLRDQNVALDIDGYRKLGRNQLRIAMFHSVSYENLEKLTKIISKAIESV